MKRLTKDDIKVTVHLPDDMSYIRKIWTDTYCNFAVGLLNSSGLPIKMKHQLVDELIERLSANKQQAS